MMFYFEICEEFCQETLIADADGCAAECLNSRLELVLLD